MYHMLTLLLAPAFAEPPHVLVVASAGLPDLVGARVEVFVAERWAFELGAGVGLLPLTVHTGVHWTALCPGCWAGHGFRLAPGADVFVFPSEPREGMAVLDVDVQWVYYRNTVGVLAGARAGAGLAWGPGSEGVKLEPALEVVPVQVGVVF
jgi:hypothetical protein